ncbi:hypothetical protein P279_27580 [Rhodobacteraceae bacterium PD-2]|nr:hypothetical protein P279_27580 [Rhodobacteraceae bacterium PD-2]
MTAFYKKPASKWALYAVLAAGIAVALMGFLAGAFIFGISIAACVLIWIVGGWYVSHRQRQYDRAVHREVQAQRKAEILSDKAPAPTR